MFNWISKHGDTVITIATIIVAFGALVTIFDQRLDAQDELISQRFDAQDRYIDQRFDAQDRHINQRFDAIDLRFEAVDQRFDAVDQRFDAHDRSINQRFDAMDKRIDRLADEVAELRKLLVGINERVSRNEGRIDVILKQMQAAGAPSP